MNEQEIKNSLDAVCAQYKINVLVDPIDYEINSPAAVDVEHDEEGNLVGIGIYDNITSLYFTKVTDKLVTILSKLHLVGHNFKTDAECLRMWGIPVNDSQLIWDTQIISHITDSSRASYGLKALAKADLAIEYPSYDDIVGKKTKKQAKERRTLDKWPVDVVSKYNATDCYVTYKLYERQRGELVPFRISESQTNVSQYYEKIEKPVSFIFQQMENRGICVDLVYLKQLKSDLELQKYPIEAEIKNELGDINLNSPKQLLKALNAKGIFPTYKTKASTDKRALATVSDPIVSQLLAYSELDTLLSMFIAPYLERNQTVVHPYFNQTGTRTGRLSCSNPNLLQIPRRTENGKLVRRMFKARDGMLMGDCDYGQIEPRILAHLSKDPVLCQMFNDGVDFHTYTAERLQIDRERAKILNLSVGYRATFKSVMAQLKVDRYEAQDQIDKWWGLFLALRRWQDRLIFDSKRSGYCETLLGRRIKVEGLSDRDSWKREGAERQLINNITQGSAAEVMKMAMLKIHNCEPNLGILVQVYDELLFESPNIEKDITTVKGCMETAVKLGVPLTVEAHTGANWDECKQ